MLLKFMCPSNNKRTLFVFNQLSKRESDGRLLIKGLITRAMAKRIQDEWDYAEVNSQIFINLGQFSIVYIII